MDWFWETTAGGGSQYVLFFSVLGSMLAATGFLGWKSRELGRERDGFRCKAQNYQDQNRKYEKLLQELNAKSEASQSKSEHELNRFASQIVQIKEFARALGLSQSEDEIIRRIQQFAVQIFDVERSAYLRVTEDGNGAKLSTVGIPRGWPPTLMDEALRQTATPISQVLDEKRLYVRVRWRDQGRQTSLAQADPLEAGYIQPILHGDRLHGMLALSESNRMDSRQAASILSILADLGAIALTNALYMQKIQEQATRDGLTGLHNHRFFQDYLSEVAQGSERIAVILSDIDHFKKFNDTFGHQTGDAVLREVAALGQEIVEREVGRIPENVLIARYGGEEFIVVMPNLTLTEARAVAEALRRRMDVAQIEVDGRKHHITLSLGVAGGTRGVDKNDLIACADEALYESKKSGRNRVTVCDRKADLARNAAEAQRCGTAA